MYMCTNHGTNLTLNRSDSFIQLNCTQPHQCVLPWVLQLGKKHCVNSQLRSLLIPDVHLSKKFGWCSDFRSFFHEHAALVQILFQVLGLDTLNHFT